MSEEQYAAAKADIHVPVEPYGYIAVDSERSDEYLQKLWETYKRLREIIGPYSQDAIRLEGIDSRSFDRFCERVIAGEQLPPEQQSEWEQMSTVQRKHVNWLYNRIAAIKRRNQ